MYFKHFVPSFIAMALGLFFIYFQSMAVAVVVLSLFGFAVAYAFYVSRLIQEEAEKKDPGFRQVALLIAKKMKILE